MYKRLIKNSRGHAHNHLVRARCEKNKAVQVEVL